MDAVQPRFNLIHRNAVDVLAWSATHTAGAIVYSPMASGLLSGSFTAARAAVLDEDDWRRRHPDFTGDALARNLALAEALGPIASRLGVTVAAVPWRGRWRSPGSPARSSASAGPASSMPGCRPRASRSTTPT